jgi:hypothetical protein
MPDAEKFDSVRAEERKHRRQTRDLRRNYFRQLPIDLASPISAACHWLLPWDAHYYPGIGRGLRQLAQNRVGTATALKWRKSNPVPLWAMQTLADALGRKARLGLEIEARLLQMIEEKRIRPRKPRGLEIIDPESGLPKYRNRVGNRRRSDCKV